MSNVSLQTAQQAEEFVGNRITMTYAKLKKVTGPAEELWKAIKEHNPGAGHWMGSYTVGEPTDFPPLQAADIWAYTIGHMQEKQKTAKEEAQIAFRFFLNATFRNQSLGNKYFTFFDRKEMMLRLGELPEMKWARSNMPTFQEQAQEGAFCCLYILPRQTGVGIVCMCC